MRQFLQIFTCLILMISLPLFQIMSVVVIKRKQQKIAQLIKDFNLEEKGKLEKLFVSSKDYPNVVAGDEIYVNDYKYDVVSAEKHGGGFMLMAINDTLEKALEKIQHAKEEHGKHPGKSLKIQHVVDWETPDMDKLLFPILPSQVICLAGDMKLPQSVFQVVIPPPESCSIG